MEFMIKKTFLEFMKERVEARAGSSMAEAPQEAMKLVYSLMSQTNDIDLDTLTALEDYLEEYKGVLVIVSHDRFFADKVTDHLFVFEGNGVVKGFRGTLTDYAEALVEIEELNGEHANAVKDDKKSNYKEDKETRVKRMNQLKFDKKEMNNIENKMEN